MEFHPNDWLGRWQNFESYITSTDPYLQLAWQEAEAAAAALPMFKSGAKQFWQNAKTIMDDQGEMPKSLQRIFDKSIEYYNQTERARAERT